MFRSSVVVSIGLVDAQEPHGHWFRPLPTPTTHCKRDTFCIPKVAAPLARADGVVSHESALELLDLTDLIADEIHISPLRSGGWTEQTNLAIRQAIRRGLTTRGRLEAEVPAKWRPWLHGSAT